MRHITSSEIGTILQTSHFQMLFGLGCLAMSGSRYSSLINKARIRDAIKAIHQHWMDPNPQNRKILAAAQSRVPKMPSPRFMHDGVNDLAAAAANETGGLTFVKLVSLSARAAAWALAWTEEELNAGILAQYKLLRTLRKAEIRHLIRIRSDLGSEWPLKIRTSSGGDIVL